MEANVELNIPLYSSAYGLNGYMISVIPDRPTTLISRKRIQSSYFFMPVTAATFSKTVMVIISAPKEPMQDPITIMANKKQAVKR